jgi:hypothetical protein
MKFKVALFSMLFAVMMFVPSVTSAQTGLTFSTGTDVVAVHTNGTWYAGSIINQTLDVKDSTSDNNGYVNSFYLLGEQEIFTSTAGFNYYGGGFKYVPTKTLSSLLKGSNIPADSFRIFVRGSVGNVVPTVGSTYLTGVVGVGASYAVTRSGSIVWNTVQAGWQNPGTFYISTGGEIFFGGQTVNAQSAKAARFRRAALALSNN